MKDHICDERCRCPKCGSFLCYWYDQHACLNPDCKWIAHDSRSGGMADTKDLKSFGSNTIGVRVPSPAPDKNQIIFKDMVIHTCYISKNGKYYTIDGAFSHCPICGDKI